MGSLTPAAARIAELEAELRENGERLDLAYRSYHAAEDSGDNWDQLARLEAKNRELSIELTIAEIEKREGGTEAELWAYLLRAASAWLFDIYYNAAGDIVIDDRRGTGKPGGYLRAEAGSLPPWPIMLARSDRSKASLRALYLG